MKRPIRWLLVASLAGCVIGAGAQPTLPATEALAAAFQRTPAWQAAQAARQAEVAGARQQRLSGQAWTASLSGLQRRQNDPSATWREWELGVERPWRWPGKQAVIDAAGEARVAQADAALAQAWRAYAGEFLARWIDWQREAAAAQVQAEVAALLARQHQAVASRLRVGDAARIDQAQARAAWLQAQAQADAAAARERLARQALATRFPDVVTPNAVDAAMPAPAPTAAPDADLRWIDAWLQHDPALAGARREAEALRAQARVEAGERRPDPTVGVRVASNRGGAERAVGLTLSVTLPDASRQAGADAAAARALAGEARVAELERQVRAEAAQRVQEAELAERQSRQLREAADAQQGVAERLARGFELGEGTLAEVLNARRLAQEQRLAAAQAEVGAWDARLRLLLAAGRLWPATDVVPAP